MLQARLVFPYLDVSEFFCLLEVRHVLITDLGGSLPVDGDPAIDAEPFSNLPHRLLRQV